MSRDYKLVDAEKAMRIHQFVSSHLAEIGRMLPDHMLTLVMRCPDNPAADAIVGDDLDVEAIIKSLEACAASIQAGAGDLH